MSTINKRILGIASLAIGIIGIYLVACLAIYRIPASDEPEFVAGKVLYKLDDNTGTNRQLFEELVMGNRVVRLEDRSVWYVSPSDYRILWPADPDELRKRDTTIKTELKVQKLMFGGYVVVEIHELDILDEPPTIIE